MQTASTQFKSTDINTKRIIDLMAQIQAASEQLTAELNELGAVGIWHTVRSRAERGAIAKMLELTDGNITEAALRLDVNRNTLSKRAIEYHICPHAPRRSQQHIWKETNSDITVHVKRNGKTLGETTTGYLIAQALQTAGYQVLVNELLDSEYPKATLSSPGHYELPALLKPRTAVVRIGGVA